MKSIVLLALLWIAGTNLSAQMGGNPVVSPEISEGNEVTFRVYAPKAVSDYPMQIIP